MAAKQKFFELVKTGTDIEWVGRRKLFYWISGIAVFVSLAMLPINAYVLEGRGRMLNWGVDFRGGTEMAIDFARPVDPGSVRKILADAGYEGVEVVSYGGAAKAGKSYLVRMGAVSIVSEAQLEKARQSLAASKIGGGLKDLQWSEGGDKVYPRFSEHVGKPEESGADQVRKGLEDAGISTTEVKPFGRAEDNTFEATLIGLDIEVRKLLDKALGAGAVEKIPLVESVGAKAGKQLQVDGVKAILGAMLLIVLYVALRFDMRFGPSTIVALLHDAIITVGAFALTYKEFSLTSLAAVLTIVGYSVNDTIVVFDRIRENAARYRDRAFDRVVNQSINETLSRTVFTSGTLLMVTLAMNVLGTGVVRDFGFAMNVGVITGTYSTVCIAAPFVIWLNSKMVASQKRSAAARQGGKDGGRDGGQEGGGKARDRGGRRRRDDETVEA